MGGFKPFRKLITPDRELNLIQDNLKDTLDSLAQNPLIGGHLLSQVPVSVGANLISHGLGRNYRSWAPMNPSASMNLFALASPDATKFLNVNSSAPGAVDIFVF